MTTKKQDASGANLEDNAPPGLSITDAEAKDARHEGAIDAAKEAGKDAYKALTDGNLPGDPAVDRWHGSDESQQYAHLIDLGLDAFVEKVTAKDQGVTETMAAGLLKLERAGKNRTPYVKALMKRLKVKSPYEVTSAGPSYTNDMTSVTAL